MPDSNRNTDRNVSDLWTEIEPAILTRLVRIEIEMEIEIEISCKNPIRISYPYGGRSIRGAYL